MNSKWNASENSQLVIDVLIDLASFAHLNDMRDLADNIHELIKMTNSKEFKHKYEVC